MLRGRLGRGACSAGAPAEPMEPFGKVCPRCGTRYDAVPSFCPKDGAALRPLEDSGDPYIGQVLLDQFRIEERIGAGGMGTVYRARQTTLGRDVAIKILHPDLASNPDAVRRFHREARISTALDHPNVVRVFLFGQLPDGSLYLVMELLRGRTLAERLRTERPLPVHRALHIATQICDAVGEAHGQGIVHRDIKPENVILIPKGRDPDFVKVLDFGIARVLKGNDATSATQSGLVFGTARYISPEGAAGERTDARSDVYSLGVLTYELLCGETPFDAPSPVTLLWKHIHESPPHLKSRPGAAHVPDAVADVVMRALSKNAEGRYDDAHELGEALRRAAHLAGLDMVQQGRDRAGMGRRSSSPNDPGWGDRGSSERNSSERGDLRGWRSRGRRTARPVPPPGEDADLGHETLASAPSPLGPATSELSIPGLPSGRRRPWRPVAAVMTAFAIGALAVASGAWIVGALTARTARDADTDQVSELRRRAEAALAAEHYDTPREHSVLALTDQLLALNPDDFHAMRIRRAASSRLVAEGERAEAEGQRDRALDRYRRALAFSDEPRIREAIERLERTPVRAPQEPAIAVAPSPVAGATVQVTATLAEGVDVRPEDRPRFVLERAGRPVGGPIDAAAGEAPGTFVATVSFPSAGRYRIALLAGRDGRRYELSTEVDVAPAPRSSESSRRGAARVGAPPSITTVGSFGPEGPTNAEGSGVVVFAPPLEQTRPFAPSPNPALEPPTPSPVATPRQPPIFPLAPPQPEPPSPPDEPPPPPRPWTSIER